MGGDVRGLRGSATSIVACSLPLACSFRLTTPPRFIRHRRRFGSVALRPRARGLSPLDPRGAMVRATKTRLFARNTVKQAGEFLGVRNREKG